MACSFQFLSLRGLSLSQPDPQLDQVRYAFDSAFKRKCDAETEADLTAELSNTLHHLYRLGELCKRRLGDRAFYDVLKTTDALRAARAAMWARAFDTHRLFAVAKPRDVYSNYYTKLYGVLIWVPLSSLPVAWNPPKYGQDTDYKAELEGKPVLDTLRGAFDGMATLLTGEE